MTKEQEKEIECIKDMINYIRFNEKKKYTEQEWFYAQEEILNLIQTQQEEIEKKDKTINEMAKQLYILGFCKELKCKECNADKFEECIKQYFERKIENE